MSVSSPGKHLAHYNQTFFLFWALKNITGLTGVMFTEINAYNYNFFFFFLN